MSQHEIDGDIIALADIFTLYAKATMQLDPTRARAITDALKIMRDGYVENGNIKGVVVISYILEKAQADFIELQSQ